MRQLSGMDSMFLNMEGPLTPMIISTFDVCDVATVPGKAESGYEEVLAAFHANADKLSMLRSKLQPVPWASTMVISWMTRDQRPYAAACTGSRARRGFRIVAQRPGMFAPRAPGKENGAGLQEAGPAVGPFGVCAVQRGELTGWTGTR